MFSLKVVVVLLAFVNAVVQASNQVVLTCESSPSEKGEQGPPGPPGHYGARGQKGDTGSTAGLENTISALEDRLKETEEDIAAMAKTISDLQKKGGKCQCMKVIGGDVWHGPGNGYFYYTIKSDMTYDQAKSKCSQLGATLATQGPKSRDVMRILEAQMSVLTTEEYWIGLTDKADEGRYVWEDGTALQSSQANWKPGEPNNAGNNEDCIGINYLDTLQWNDYPCSRDLYALCERKP
uniref:C-type lectin domain-containing protein n=1 Tax=Ciona savignyi TaxID=51511 RepID=H2YTW6_CIOSA